MRNFIQKLVDPFLFFKSFKKIDASKAKDLIDKGRITLVDIRKPEAFAAGHIPGAISVPKEKMAEFIRTADKSKPVICYCYKGISSCLACVELKKAGFISLYSVDGGIDALQKLYGK